MKAAAVGDGVFSSTEKETKPLSITLANSAGEKLEASKIRLTNFTGEFSYKDGMLAYSPNGETARGKSCTLIFEVYPMGRGDNEKPVTVKYKVKIS